MIYLYLLICEFFALWLAHFLRHFADNLAQDIAQSYAEIFPKKFQKKTPHFELTESALSPLPRQKCGAFLLSFFSLASFTLAYLAQPNPAFACACSLFVLLLYAIALLDWHYQLIAMELCQLLLALGLAMAYFQLGELSLKDSLSNAWLMFLIFYGLYQISRYYYGQEVFGRGDYWLIGALASFLPMQMLPMFIFLASSSALLFVAWRKTAYSQRLFLPFAPFLNVTAGVIFSCRIATFIFA